MRFLVRATVSLEAGNAQLRDPTFGPKLMSTLASLNAEATYFGVENGARCIYLIVTVNGSDDIPRIAEPLWFICQATVDFIPLITLEDMAKAEPDIEKLVRSERESKGIE